MVHPVTSPAALVRALIASVGIAIAVLGVAAEAKAHAIQATGSVGSCTPELVYSLRPGNFDARGSGHASIATLRYTDAQGVLQVPSAATLDWEARAIVDAPAAVGARPGIGGRLDLAITTAAGERVTFGATCIAGSGAYDLGFLRGITVYANGLARGWPGGSPTRRSFVHFEAWTFGAETFAFVAMIDGVDCALNFGILMVTNAPFGIGSGAFSGLPAGDFYSETDCGHRFGDPFPRGQRLLLPE